MQTMRFRASSLEPEGEAAGAFDILEITSTVPHKP